MITMNDDLISRQAAIDALNKYRLNLMKNGKEVNFQLWDCMDIILKVPSAQSEVIYCKECVCGHCEVWLCGDGPADAYGYCGLTNLRVLPYNYCSWAERKENG